jgi:hypothetical protein
MMRALQGNAMTLLALLPLFAVVQPCQAELDSFLFAAEARHGLAGKRAATFLIENMPQRDRETLSSAFLSENLDLAMAARAEFAWAKAVPEELFLNDVLPYAVFDEPRDPWRAELLGLARPIVAGAKSASEAAQALNAKLFNTLGLHYNTGRKRPNQSFRESREQGKATCTGLSITLVEACRAVGIPARAVGTPLWSNGRGNHTWIEIWDATGTSPAPMSTTRTASIAAGSSATPRRRARTCRRTASTPRAGSVRASFSRWFGARASRAWPPSTSRRAMRSPRRPLQLQRSVCACWSARSGSSRR